MGIRIIFLSSKIYSEIGKFSLVLTLRPEAMHKTSVTSTVDEKLSISLPLVDFLAHNIRETSKRAGTEADGAFPRASKQRYAKCHLSGRSATFKYRNSIYSV